MNKFNRHASESGDPDFSPVGADLRVRPRLDSRLRGNDGKGSLAVCFKPTYYESRGVEPTVVQSKFNGGSRKERHYER